MLRSIVVQKGSDGESSHLGHFSTFCNRKRVEIEDNVNILFTNKTSVLRKQQNIWHEW